MFQGLLKRLLKGLLFFVLGLTAAGYTSFVLILLWNWFGAPAFHLPRIAT